ncbi:hypothetical protein [uncultured Roseovarius sp.]|uniref:hypothetical protein n=1 Tax=uncultured Roseovarius sp. TaxID=293344 RepID=UPI002632D5DA|nr:hypothetical protein [uncultured Roseovarius sp.]
MFRLITMVLFALALGACTNPNDIDETPTYLGNFHFGHNVVVAPNLTKGPASRDASKEEWITAMKEAMDERFRRYEGEKLYHLGISVEGYVLAIPGVPIVASPKSALILNVTVWDDATQSKLNEKPELITVVESFSGHTILGSGLTQSKKKQMRNLTQNAAKLVENWLFDQNNEFGWFESDGRPAKEKLSLLGNPLKDASETEATTEDAPTETEASEDATLPEALEAQPEASSEAAAAAAAAAIVIEEPEVTLSE